MTRDLHALTEVPQPSQRTSQKSPTGEEASRDVKDVLTMHWWGRGPRAFGDRLPGQWASGLGGEEAEEDKRRKELALVVQAPFEDTRMSLQCPWEGQRYDILVLLAALCGQGGDRV